MPHEDSGRTTLRLEHDPLVELPRGHRTEVTAALFAELGAAGDESERSLLRQRIVLANASVARSLARRYERRGIDLEDLEQTAYLSLVGAVRRFDPQRGTDFLSYAVPTIAGALKRHFRDLGWTIRVPRRVQEVQRLINREDLPEVDDTRYGTRTVEALAGALEVSPREVEAALMARGCFAAYSLEAEFARGRMRVIDSLTRLGDDAVGAVEARADLAHVWRLLSVRDAEVLRLRYIEDLTQAAIAVQVGLTQAQVSRILTRLHAQLRAQLGDGVDSSRRAG